MEKADVMGEVLVAEGAEDFDDGRADDDHEHRGQDEENQREENLDGGFLGGFLGA